MAMKPGEQFKKTSAIFGEEAAGRIGLAGERLRGMPQYAQKLGNVQRGQV